MFRVAIIGCGRIGVEFEDSHLNAYLACPDTELVALCDKDRKKIPTQIVHGYAGYKDMLQEGLDIVSVCTPPETHCKIVCDIAPFVKAVYLEKPIALTLEDADKIIKACHQHGVILQINHQRRFAKPKMRWSRGIINNGSHAVDLVRQLCGDDWKKKVELEFIDDDSYPPVFELQITQPDLIKKGVEHLVECLKQGKQSVSSGEEARESLREVLLFERDR